MYDDARISPWITGMPESVERDVDSVGAYLRAHEPDPHRRIKAIHDYAADRVSYDATADLSGPPAADCDVDTVFRTHRAVCCGYARLVEALGRATGDGVRFVSGKAIVDGTPGPHAWNEAWLDEAWRPIDATWDAGWVEGNEFHKKYSTRYFLPERDEFTRDHIDGERENDASEASDERACPPSQAEAAPSASSGNDFFKVVRDANGCVTKVTVFGPPGFVFPPPQPAPYEYTKSSPSP
jgi:hypothetical protein